MINDFTSEIRILVRNANLAGCYANIRKIQNMTVGIRRAAHVTPFNRRSWQWVRLQEAVARSVNHGGFYHENSFRQIKSIALFLHCGVVAYDIDFFKYAPCRLVSSSSNIMSGWQVQYCKLSQPSSSTSSDKDSLSFQSVKLNSTSNEATYFVTEIRGEKQLG
jgi:hypothetical protein